MSVVKRIIQDNIESVKVDELLAQEYEQAGYGGITLTKTPLGAQINLYAMRPGRVIGKRGRAIKIASEKLETQLGLSNPQITVVEVEVPELNPRIMASRVANALERGVHFRRAIFWSLRSSRSRFEKVVEGYVPKSGEPALRYVRTATMHVKMKRGTLGVTVRIVPPDAVFPDKIDLSGLPEYEYQPPVIEDSQEIIEKENQEVEIEIISETVPNNISQTEKNNEEKDISKSKSIKKSSKKIEQEENINPIQKDHHPEKIISTEIEKNSSIPSKDKEE
jgi:small subunit ribosomal protein S3